MRKRWLYAALSAAIVSIAAIASLFIPLPEAMLDRSSLQSMRITDFRGVLLRETLNDEDGRSRWVTLDEIPPSLVQATIAVEDKRFYHHPGVDPLAVVRSMVANLRTGSVASGGSTITQQVVKAVAPHPRTFIAKMREAWMALRLERQMSKAMILEQYLNRVSYGGTVRGVEAAAERYFHKPVRDLSLAESALLAGLPNAPTSLNPLTHSAQAKSRQMLVLRRMRDQGVIIQQDYERAAAQPLQLRSPQPSFRAPHVCDMVVRQYGAMNALMVSTTIDEALQEQIQPIIEEHCARLKKRNVTNAAVVVIENQTGEVRALIGSRDYFDERIHGQVNGAIALRQPGSAIKPLMYALAFERGHTPAEIVPDIPTAIPDLRGDYVPENYDRIFHGPVSIRTALACSYNVPAVRVLESIGKELFLQKLRESGFTSLTASADFYGYGLTLGNAEVSLLELTNAYRMLANSGIWSPPVIVKEAHGVNGAIVTMPDTRTSRRVYREDAAFLIADILSDGTARRPAFGSAFRFPFACAVKTGTTKDYKDNWTIGYTTRYTVGVWAGNFDGSPMRGVSGVTGAGQIFTDVMTLLHTAPYGTAPAQFAVPSGLERRTICPRSGRRPASVCPNTTKEWFITGTMPEGACALHREFLVHDDAGIALRRIYECYGPEYALWAQSSGLPLPPSDAEPVESDDVSHAPARHARLVIASPMNGDSYKIDPALRREYQTITIRGFFPDHAEDVRLVIDGITNVPFTERGCPWRLEKGVHQFQLIAMLNDQRIQSRTVTVTVE